jgi:hypothetical protein
MEKHQAYWIYIHKLIGEGFIYSGRIFDFPSTLGSGIIGSKEGKDNQKYPIYNPLFIHDYDHMDLLNHASSFIIQLVDDFLRTGTFSQDDLDRAHLLFNSSLYIDNRKIITKETLIEAILNFCYDYTEFPQGYRIRQPINYLFDIVGIDGIYSDYYCISFIPADFEGVQYS